MFYTRPGNADCVDFLERVPPPHVPTDLADEQYHGRGILLGHVNAGGGVGGAGAAGDEGDARTAGQFAVRLGHHRGAALVAADHGVDRRVVQGVEHGEIAFAGHAVEALDPLGLEAVHENLAAVGHDRDRFMPMRPRWLP